MLPFLGAAISAVAGMASANKAASAQKSAANKDYALKNKIYEETKDRFDPFYQKGTQSLQAVGHALGLNDAPEGYAGLEQSPAAKFALESGIDDVQASAAGAGSLYSGRTLEALERKRFGIAASDRENQLNRLMSLVGMGQAAAGNQAAAGQNFAVGGGQALQNYGDASAAGIMGANNAFQNGIGNAVGYYNYKNHLDGIK